MYSQVWMNSRDKVNTASDWAYGLANGHTLAVGLNEESNGENVLSLLT